MAQLDQVKKHLKRGKVYRRNDLTKWSKAVDRHLGQMVSDGTLQKLSTGLYYFPKESAFGKTPPSEEELVKGFLKDDRFLLTSPNDYNGLGVGTTQLYNKRVVYNHKRHGEFRLGNRTFEFHVKHHFPRKLTREFLLVDLVNNVDQLAEDRERVLEKALAKAATTNSSKLRSSIEDYGSAKTKKLFYNFLNSFQGQNAKLSS
ncbi:MAG TPA: DUF6088 family protein [Cyclobacteriaceae bacterium]|nr:DUF6088 family protein [Cyclobacteriaceae bacterium]